MANKLRDSTPYSSLSLQLKQFSKDLAISNEDWQLCIQYKNEVEKILQNSLHGFSVARVVCAGSVGKKIALHCRYDLDIVVLFNVPQSENFVGFRTRLMPTLRTVLERGFSVSVEIKGVTSMSFRKWNLKFDILPAKNAISDSTMDYSDIAKAQYDSILRLIKNPRDAFLFMISMNEISVQYILNQSDFCRCLILLGKYWLFKRVGNVHFKGRSSIIELVALHAAIETENKKTEVTLYHGFLLFLKLWVNVSQMKIAFYTYYSQNDSRLRSHSVPYLIDPINPYNDRLKSLKPHHQNQMAAIATASYQELERMKGLPRCSLEEAATTMSEILSTIFNDSSMSYQPQLYTQRCYQIQSTAISSSKPCLPTRPLQMDQAVSSKPTTQFTPKENYPVTSFYQHNYPRQPTSTHPQISSTYPSGVLEFNNQTFRYSRTAENYRSPAPRNNQNCCCVLL